MTTAETSGDDRLWNASITSNKSWLEIMEEEERELESTKKGVSPLRRYQTDTKVAGPFNGVDIKAQVKTEPDTDDVAQDLPVSTIPSKMPVVEGLPTFGKTLSTTTVKTPVKKEPSEIFQEDLSLTGHLDKFGLVSPCKVDRKDQANTTRSRCFKTPEKSRSLCQATIDKAASEGKQIGKRKLPGLKTDDDAALMPSPSKISRVSVATPPNTIVTRKRQRDILTPTPKRSPTKKKREQETDPDILARRQKQIDYGKNTMGYERYSQLVPREARKKMYPKTPPLHLKFSRRAWDGLVKVWRQRLHFWDPPSEGGGNPDCLDIQSETSDCSSTDGSLPSTPVQDWKRHKNSLPGSASSGLLQGGSSSKKSTKIFKRSLSSHPADEENSNDKDETAEEFLTQGCTPLTD